MENIIWIDRGIIISLIYIILKTYNKLKEKYVIIRNNRIRKFLQFLFPKLNLINNEKNRYSNESDSDEDHKDYINFFIRSTPTKGSNNYIVIDYISNYNKIIPTKEIWLVPYYDKNDPLFFYIYDHQNDNIKSNDEYLNVIEQYKIINHFTENKRDNFKFDDKSEEFSTWDLFFETGTIQRFIKSDDTQKSITLSKNPTDQFLFIINKYLNNVNFLNDYKPPKPEIIYEQCPKPDSIDVTYPIANLNILKSFGLIDSSGDSKKEQDKNNKQRKETTNKIIKIIDQSKTIPQGSTTTPPTAPPISQNVIPQGSVAMQSKDSSKMIQVKESDFESFLDIINEKILSLQKIYS